MLTPPSFSFPCQCFHLLILSDNVRLVQTEGFETGYEGQGGKESLRSTLQTHPHVHGGDHPIHFTRGCDDGART